MKVILLVLSLCNLHSSEDFYIPRPPIQGNPGTPRPKRNSFLPPALPPSPATTTIAWVASSKAQDRPT